MTVKRTTGPDLFTLAAERAAAGSLRADPLWAFEEAGCPDGAYTEAADAFDELVPELPLADLHPVAAPRVVALLAERVPTIPEPVLLAFVREELLAAASAAGTLADARIAQRLRALSLIHFA